MKQRIIILFFLIVTVAAALWQLLFNSEKQNITFNEQIAPIIYTNCSPCHRKDGVAPFALMCYEDVVKKAKNIAFVTRTKFMPPWPADPSYSHFVGEKILSDKEIEMIQLWVKNDCVKGDNSKAPVAPDFPVGSYFGKPDLVIKMNKSYAIKGNNNDQFLLMKYPYEIGKDTFIKAIEFVPNQKKVVHHVNGFLIQYEADKKQNVFEGEWWVNTESNTYKEAFEKMKLAQDDGTYPLLTPSVTNYLPGVLPVIYPDGIGGFRMKRKGAVLFKDIHYGPSPIDLQDSSYLNIFFAKQAPTRQLLELQMGTLGKSEITPPLVIPPNEVKTFKTQIRIPFNISVLTVNPHMHLLGKSFLAYAVKPDGDTIPLIKINKWDFRWQYFYTYKRMLKIPAGSIIYVFGTFDNTKNNPNNPFNPPQQVSEREGSMRTTDEMFQFIISYLPYNKGDENISLE